MENEEKNHGLLVAPPKPGDYIVGGVNEIVSAIKVKDWSLYLGAPENQFSTETDFKICATMSGVDHSISTILNYMLMNNLLTDEALNFFHNNNYIKDGLFSLSSRFSAKLNGTETLKGNYLNLVANHAHNEGILSEALWPTKPDMTWNQFYSPIPANLIALAKKVLWFINIQYQWVNKEDIEAKQAEAPVQSGIAICPGYNSSPVVKACTINLSHAVLNYNKSPEKNFKIFDHYNPYNKQLANDYDLPLNLQYMISLKPITLRSTMVGKNVLQMQKDLNKLGYGLTEDSFFGPKTELKVKSFQSKYGLVADGIAGQITLAKIKQLVQTPSSEDKIGLWIGAIKIIEGAKPYRNNPGNLRFANQKYAVWDNGFCKFDTYEHGYQALKDLLIRACTGNSKNYDPDETLYEFYAGVSTPNRFGRKVYGYAPASDGNDPQKYAEFVAKEIGVSPQTKIGSLV